MNSWHERQDPRDILEIWAPSMPMLAEAAQHDARLLRMAAALAINGNVGRPFSQALLAFLVDKRLPTLQLPSSSARPDGFFLVLTLNWFHSTTACNGTLGSLHALQGAWLASVVCDVTASLRVNVRFLCAP